MYRHIVCHLRLDPRCMQINRPRPPRPRRAGSRRLSISGPMKNVGQYRIETSTTRLPPTRRFSDLTPKFPRLSSATVRGRRARDVAKGDSTQLSRNHLISLRRLTNWPTNWERRAREECRDSLRERRVYKAPSMVLFCCVLEYSSQNLANFTIGSLQLTLKSPNQTHYAPLTPSAPSWD